MLGMGTSGRHTGYGHPFQAERAEAARVPAPFPADLMALSLALRANGVMVPFRPDAGAPKGTIHWREITVGVLHAWAGIAPGPGRGSPGWPSAGWWPCWAHRPAHLRVTDRTSAYPPANRPPPRLVPNASMLRMPTSTASGLSTKAKRPNLPPKESADERKTIHCTAGALHCSQNPAEIAVSTGFVIGTSAAMEG